MGSTSAGAPVGRALTWATGRRPRSATTDRVLLAGAGVLFVVAFALGLRAVPRGAVEVTVWPFALVVLAVPATSVANALEYAVAARIGGRRVAGREAFEVSVLSSAANLLPLPGAALVRVRAMRRAGTSYRRALSVTAVVGGAWLATSLVLAGGILAVRRDAAVAAAGVVAVLGVGLLGLVASAVAVRALAAPGDALRLSVALLATEVLTIALAALRYSLVLRGLGLEAGAGQAVALTVAGVLASAIGFVPGGLGLREALAGVIAGLVGLPAAVGVLAAAVDRLVALPVLAALATAVAALRGSRHAEAGGEAPAA